MSWLEIIIHYVGFRPAGVLSTQGQLIVAELPKWRHGVKFVSVSHPESNLDWESTFHLLLIPIIIRYVLFIYLLLVMLIFLFQLALVQGSSVVPAAADGFSRQQSVSELERLNQTLQPLRVEASESDSDGSTTCLANILTQRAISRGEGDRNGRGQGQDIEFG